MTLPTSAKEQSRFTPSDHDSEAREAEETAANKLRGKKREQKLAEIAARFASPPIYLLATPTILERAKWRRSVLATGARWHDDDAMVACLKRGIAEVVAPAQEANLLDIVDRFAGYDEGQAPEDLAIDFEEIERTVQGAYPAYAGLAADRAYWLSVAPIIAAQHFLRGWENIEAPFEQRAGQLTEDCLALIPEEHVMEIGLKVIELMSPTEGMAKN
jgi:hypothetical protein